MPVSSKKIVKLKTSYAFLNRRPSWLAPRKLSKSNFPFIRVTPLKQIKSCIQVQPLESVASKLLKGYQTTLIQAHQWTYAQPELSLTSYSRLVYGIFLKNGNLRFLLKLFKNLALQAPYEFLTKAYKPLDPVFASYCFTPALVNLRSPAQHMAVSTSTNNFRLIFSPRKKGVRAPLRSKVPGYLSAQPLKGVYFNTKRLKSCSKRSFIFLPSPSKNKYRGFPFAIRKLRRIKRIRPLRFNSRRAQGALNFFFKSGLKLKLTKNQSSLTRRFFISKPLVKITGYRPTLMLRKLRSVKKASKRYRYRSPLAGQISTYSTPATRALFSRKVLKPYINQVGFPSLSIEHSAPLAVGFQRKYELLWNLLYQQPVLNYSLKYCRLSRRVRKILKNKYRYSKYFFMIAPYKRQLYTLHLWKYILKFHDENTFSTKWLMFLDNFYRADMDSLLWSLFYVQQRLALKKLLGR